MTLITDPDDLNQGTEIIFDTAARTVQLLQAGNLSTDGVTIRTIYSFSKEEWKIKRPVTFCGAVVSWCATSLAM